MEPAPLLAGIREHLTYCFPEAERTVADGQHGCGHPAAAAITQQIDPRLGRFPVPVGERDQFLAPVSTYPDHHQQTEFLLVQAHLALLGDTFRGVVTICDILVRYRTLVQTPPKPYTQAKGPFFCRADRI